MGIMVRVILYCVFLCSFCKAADYYVSPVGSDAGSGTFGDPWKTVSYATKSRGAYLQPGDSVFLRAGVYSGNTNAIDINGLAGAVSGTSNAPITVKAYPGESAIVCDVVSPYSGVLIKNLSWFVFDGITYSNCNHSVTTESCTNFVWKNCSFGWMPQDGSAGYAGFLFWGNSQFNTVTNCYFTQWGTVNESGNDVGASISIGDESGDSLMWYNLIVSNRFIFAGHDHFQLNTGYNIIRGNLFVNAPWSVTNSTHHTINYGTEENMYGAYGERHTKPGDAGTTQIDMRNVWEGNQFLYTGPPHDHNGAFGIELGTHQSIYRNNIIAFSLAAGIYFNTSGATAIVNSNTIYNNVIYGNGLSWVYGGDGMKAVSYGIAYNDYQGRMTNNFLVNNIIWHNLPGNLSPDSFTWQVLRGNFTNESINPMFFGTNGVGYTFDQSSLPDFRLQSTSPCIDAGTWLATTTAAGSGTTLAVNNSLYFSDGNRIVTGDTIQLQGSTATAIVSSNDWQNNTLYLDRSLTWTEGQGVSLTYNGSAPDMGAYEYYPTAPPQRAGQWKGVNQ